MRDEDSSITGHILQREVAGHTHEQSLRAASGDRPQRPVAADLGRRKPDLASARRPCQSALGREFLRQSRLLAGTIDDRNRAAVVSSSRMVHEGDDIPLG